MGAYEWFQAGADLQSGQSVVALPGEIVTFSLTLTNQGNLADTFALDLPINTLGWNVSLQPAQVGLAAGESAAIQVLVEVPAAALGGLVADLTVRAVSAVDPAIIAVAALQVEVADVAGLALTPDNSASAQPGETLVFHHTLSNAGNFTDTVSLSASSDQGWTVLVQPASAPIPLGASIPVTVTVNVPEGAQAGILDSTTLTAQSSAANGATSATAQDQTTVLHVPGLSLGPDHTAGVLEGTQVIYEHRLENTGNGPDTFNLSLASSQGWAAALEANSVALAAGEAVTVAVTLDIPAGAAGLVDLTTLTAVSTADGSLSASAADATAAQAPQPPGAVLSLLPDNASLALPGETAVYTHTLTNLSSFTVTAVLGVASGQGWPAWVQPAALLLAPGASVVAEVSVWVPESAAAGTVDETILTAAAQDAAATVTDTTTVDETPVTAGGSLYLPFLAK